MYTQLESFLLMASVNVRGGTNFVVPERYCTATPSVVNKFETNELNPHAALTHDSDAFDRISIARTYGTAKVNN